MNVFTSGSRHQPWVWQVTGLCFILGVLLAGSLQTVTLINREGGAGGRPGFVTNPSVAERLETKKLQDEITKVRAEKTRLEETLAKGDGLAKTLNEELQKTKILAGLTEVQGPGVVLVLQDSKKGPPSNRMFEKDNYIIHDYTIQQAINELNASGAEAISINGQRIIGRTPVRCVGPTAIVNDVRIASPFEIRAIGNPDTLWGGLNLPGGYMDMMIKAYDPAMGRMERRKLIQVPGYTGSTDLRFARPVPSAEKPDRGGKPSPPESTEPAESAGQNGAPASASKRSDKAAHAANGAKAGSSE